MRNKIRIKETDLIMVRGKVNAVVAQLFPYLVVHCSLRPPPLPLSPSLSPLSPHQLGLFSPLSSNGDAGGSHSPAVVDEVLSPTPLESGKPIKSSEKFVIGRSHEFVESDVKFRIPPVCAYCSIIIQRMSYVQMQ